MARKRKVKTYGKCTVLTFMNESIYYGNVKTRGLSMLRACIIYSRGSICSYVCICTCGMPTKRIKHVICGPHAMSNNKFIRCNDDNSELPIIFIVSYYLKWFMYNNTNFAMRLMLFWFIFKSFLNTNRNVKFSDL